MGTVIIIPTYFAGQMLQNCITSILKNVENPNIYINKNSVGWLCACNDAIDNTIDDVLLVNDDTIILTDVVKAMSSLAYSDPAIGIVGGKSLAPNAETIINYGIQIFPDGNTAHRYFGQPKDSVKVEKQKAVEGSLMYIKRGLIDDIGMFDPRYGMGYRAEVDFAFRAREKGWKVMSTPDAEYIHYQSQTAGKLGIKNDTHELFMSDWSTKLTLGEI